LRELGVQILATASAHQINAARTAVNGDEDFSSVISEWKIWRGFAGILSRPTGYQDWTMVSRYN
jgi:hypothetical protein